MKDNSISVIIPTYNNGSEIYNCLKSVILQTRKELIKEVIIVNDGSTDNTQDILNNILVDPLFKQFRIKVYNHKNHGVSYSRNFAMENSKGEWLAFLDADDQWLKNKLALQEKVIDNFKNVQMVGGNVNSKIQKVGLFKKPDISKVKAIDMIIRSFPQTSTVMINRLVFSNTSRFDENQSYCEDLNWFTQICHKYNYIHLNKQLVIYGYEKPQVGNKKGLSSNRYEMNRGARKNLKDFFNLKIINALQFIILYVLLFFKEFRRLLIARNVIK